MKKLTSALLCFTMTFGLLSTTALAAVTEIKTSDLKTSFVDTSALASGKDNGYKFIQLSPAEYTFKIDASEKTEDGATDTKSYVILKSVNAAEGDGYFVMVDGGAPLAASNASANWGYMSVDANKGTTVRVFDPENSNSLAYYLNQDSYINAQFPIMKPYIENHTWYTEATTDQAAYSATCKIMLPSVTELVENIDRMGIVDSDKVKTADQLLKTRTPYNNAGTKDYTNEVDKNKYARSSVWFVRLLSGNFLMYAEPTPYRYSSPERACFYLSADFFKNVKCTSTVANGALAQILKENMSVLEMLDMGYTEDELTALGIAVEYPTAVDTEVKGHLAVGGTIYADFEWSHKNAETGEGKTTYQWYKNGEKIVGETGVSYMLTADDAGAEIKVEITPVDEFGQKGRSVFAQAGTVSNKSLEVSIAESSIKSGSAEIEDMSAVTSVTGTVNISANTNTDGLIHWIAVFDKTTNECKSLKIQSIAAGETGEKTITTNTFEASENNYVKMFVTDKLFKPVFGIEYFRR